MGDANSRKRPVRVKDWATRGPIDRGREVDRVEET